MGTARRLLLVAALALAITTDADATLSTLTLSPDVGSLITTRDNSVNTSPTTVIGSAESGGEKATKATKRPTTTAPPATTAPPTTKPVFTSMSQSDSTSKSNDEEQETTNPPATVSPGSTSDRSTNDSETQTDTTKTSASASTSSKSSTATVDSLNDNTGGISTGSSSKASTILPIGCGALACVGAIVMAVTYKRKLDSNDDNDNGSSSDCEYTIGSNFTPENRGLNPVREDKAPTSIQVPQSSIDMSASGAIADFTGTNSSVSSSSPFGSTYSKVRVSSPVANYSSSSETTMEFQDTCPRPERGSNVVLTFNEVSTESRRGAAPQVQL